MAEPRAEKRDFRLVVQTVLRMVAHWVHCLVASWDHLSVASMVDS